MTTVISVENLSKTYQVGQIGTGTFANDMKVWWAMTRGKPTPFICVGEKDHGICDDEELWVLRDVCLSVSQGETFGIISHISASNRILSRVTVPTTSNIKVNGNICLGDTIL